MEIPELIDLGSSEDERLNSFAGIINYSSGFVLSETNGLVLDLGNVYGITEVILNGHHLGTRWYGNHRYMLDNVVKNGYNKVEVKLTTTLYNYCRTQTENPNIKAWLRTTEPEPAGIIGPVKIYNLYE